MSVLAPQLWSGGMAAAALPSPLPAGLPGLWLVDRRHWCPLPPALPELLSVEERQRLERLRRGDDRERFLLGRVVLRQLLAAVLKLPAAELRFVAGPHGKPQLDCGHGTALPQFNVSHSGDLILVALHAHRAVGVDVERLRQGLDWQPIARRCLPPEDCRAITAQEPSNQLPAFVQHWCRLEARLKAAGTGFATAPWPESEPPTKERAPDPAQVELHDVELPQGYCGAVALL